MKKLLLLASIIFLLAGCSGQDNPGQKENQNQDKPVADKEKVSVQLNNIDIKTPDGKIIVKGNANATNDEFFFTLKYGDTVVVEERKIELDTDKSGWGSFELAIDQPDDGKTAKQIPVFTFYSKNNEGEIVNPNYVPVDVGKE
ncbi:hypothetical protein F3157_07195 [Virgibacillus dakarensis]|uniref:Bacterial spore germination immunoglobulin-like domain-containing protein n=1 Tax=Lentibacillus populi TaxID=1827502 RepID=A0A9W5TXS7_9BACI|nr:MULTISPECIES: membrane lipoprotein lipid attachment site-containing protein [Bacillaceae]MBT2215383.1 lipoprotein [Virgibacillus dakarensis]MTW85447.1 hypothetical protein [Virgibacillus dakarensis]GGB39764.1 hypothetical protein GCM10011409_16590 [Lentibacillus populi]